MIVTLVDCSDCGKRHGGHYDCKPDPEAYRVISGDEEVATATTLANAEFAVRTLLHEGPYVVLRIVGPDGPVKVGETFNGEIGWRAA